MITRMRLFASAALFLLCLSCACNKEPSVEKVGKPEMNGIFAYLAESDTGYQDIFLQNADRTENVSSTWPISSPSHLRLSADGRTLLFEGKQGGKWGIYTYDITTGEVPVLLTSGIAQDCRYPRFAPNGNIVFSKAGQIALLNLGSGTVSAVTFDASATNTYSALLPDGKTCVYISSSGASTCIMQTDLTVHSSASVRNTGGATSLEVCDDGLLVYSVPGKGICTQEGTLFPANGQLSGVFGNWVTFRDGTSFSIGNVLTGETYSLDVPAGEWLVYSDATVSIVPSQDGGYKRGGGDVITSDTDRPALSGRVVYHNYTSYDAMDSRMYVYDFASDNLQEISTAWTNVRHPMNAHFSPDGKSITFMGIGVATDSWDIFTYELGSSLQPENLTSQGAYRDEDPKYSFDGTKICFKRNGHLSEIELASKSVRVLSGDDGIEYGMPYYSVSGDKIVFGGGSGSETFIGLWDIASAKMSKLYDKEGTVEYYPITIDEESFYYTGHVSASSPYDQLYIGHWDGSAAQYLPFNKTNADYSDACPVSDNWLILCSTRQGSRGQYDLYIANKLTGAIYPLSDYNDSINTAKSELGASYTTKR